MIINWAAIAALGSLFAIIAVVVGASFTHGKLTQRVDTNEAGLKSQAAILEKHGDTLVEHGEAIAGLQARPRYVNGSSH